MQTDGAARTVCVCAITGWVTGSENPIKFKGKMLNCFFSVILPLLSVSMSKKGTKLNIMNSGNYPKYVDKPTAAPSIHETSSVFSPAGPNKVVSQEGQVNRYVVGLTDLPTEDSNFKQKTVLEILKYMVETWSRLLEKKKKKKSIT